MTSTSVQSDHKPGIDDAILYDLASLVEWPEEKEVSGGLRDEIQLGFITGGVRKVQTSLSRWTWATVRAVGIPVRTGAPCLLPPDLVKLVNSQQSWSFAQSNDGRFIAVLQDSSLEIRSSKEDFNLLVGRYTFSKDPYPRWRKVAWSQYSTTIAFSDSDGTVHVCDLKGILLFSFQTQVEEERSFDCSGAICGLLFVGDEVSRHKETTMHLLIVSYSGAVTCIEINDSYKIGYRIVFKFDFAANYSNGVSAVVYDKEHALVIVGGCANDTSDDTSKAARCGITAWRLLSGEPYMKIVNVYSETEGSRIRPGFFRRLSTVPSDIGKKLRGHTLGGIYSLSLSPCGKLLASIHLNGSLSIWEVPSMRHTRTWEQKEQPDSDGVGSEATKSITSGKKLKDYPMLHNVIDCNWWSESAVILARCTGSLAVVRVTGNILENLFGECEWLEPAPRVSSCKNEGFLALECETKSKTLKRQRVDTNEDPVKEEDNDYDPFLDDSDGEENPSLSSRLKGLTNSTMYNLTEMEYFRPPRKRAKLVTKSYRLFSLTKTTPEKLFERKIEAEEYGEALALAQKYGLDGNRVFQRQWRKAPVSVASIQDYLSKICKRSWVLHECCERVPEELDATRELLMFALRATDMNEIPGQGRRKLASEADAADSDSDYDEYEGFDVEEQRRQEIKQRHKYVKKWSKFIDFQNLSLDQKEMIRTRRKILKYLDRLATYEYLLGGYDAARERYSRDRFATFRQQDMLISTVEYARTCEWRAVEALMTFHGDELRQHRLPILSNFPKTLSPSEYEVLLPEIDAGGSVVPWAEEKHRDPGDWCEQEEYQHVYSPLTDLADPAAEFYEENPDLSRFRTDSPSGELMREWYSQQAIQMDLDARDIEGALDILRYGTEHGIAGLASLTRDFRTLEALVYECGHDPGLTLVQLQEKSNLDRLRMILNKSSKEMYVKNIHRWAFPFLHSCNEEQPGVATPIFEEYVTQMAEEDLTYPSLIFTAFLHDKTMPSSILNLESFVKLALASVYLSSQPDQLNLVKQIHSCLTKVDKSTLRSAHSEALSKIAKLEKHVYACSMLAKYRVKVTPAHILEVEDDRHKAQKLFVRLSRTAGSFEPGLGKNEWNTLLSDMLQLRERLFSDTCGLEAAVCLEVFVESLLTSGNVVNFQIAGERMMRSADEEHEASRRHLYTAPRKLSYESSVDLVIKSSQEYFDASSLGTGDNMLMLARECLLLITDRPPLTREKLDLIEGVILLDHFGVDKLPLQVRLTDDRLDLISKAIETSDQAYRKTEPLLRLGKLLRACGSNKEERKGRILVMIVNKALDVMDFQSAYCLCQELIAMPYAPAWDVCLKLASRDKFEDNVAKRDILAYAACYCDGDRLKVVMEQMRVLNSLALQEAIKEYEKQDETDSLQTDFESAEVDASKDDAANTKMTQKKKSNPLEKLMSTTSNLLSPSKMLETTTMGTKAVLSATGTVLSATGTVLSATSNTTKAVISNVSDTNWWKSTISQTLSVLPGSEMEDSDKDITTQPSSNDDFEHQGCPEFYADIIDDSVSKYELMVGTSSYYVPEAISLGQAKFRLARLTDQTEMSSVFEEVPILKELIANVLPYDFALGIAYLLVLTDANDSYACLQKFPVSALSIQVSLYYFSIRLMSLVLPEDSSSGRAKVYEVVPIDLIKHAISLSSSDFTDNPDCDGLAFYINQLKEQLYDFAQGEKLHQLGRGIDLGRFRMDTEYREETILGLAMTSDEEQYKLAVSLAHRSGTDLWLVLVTHLEYLFTECQDQLDCSDLHAHLKKLNMVPELVTLPHEFFERMDKYVYPFISGKDHERLHLYFSLLNECQLDSSAVSSHNVCDIPPAEHMKMLKKIKSVTPDLEYKELITQDSTTDTNSASNERVMSVLRPVLDAKNVLMFAKLVPKIPYSSHTVTASSLYLEVAKSLIWGDVKQDAPVNDDEPAWIHRYESCNSLLRMCNPNDLLQFFQDFLFLSKSSRMLPLKTRQDIIKRGVKMCKIQGTKERKNQLDAEILNNGQSFHTVLPTFILMSKHLDSYSTSFISDMFRNSRADPTMERYLKLYDETQSRPEQVLNLATLMLLEGCSPQFVQQFLAVVPGNKWSPANVLQECIERVIGCFSGVAEDKDEAFMQLSSLVCNISAHIKRNGKIYSAKQVIELLRPFCVDGSVDLKLRVDTLELLEKEFELEEADSRLLQFHRTRAVVRDGWGEEVSQKIIPDADESNGVTEAVACDENRLKIFNGLLDLYAKDLFKLKHLVTLLNIWPKFSSVETSDSCWNAILSRMAELGTDGGREIIDVTKQQIAKQERPRTSTVEIVFEKLMEHDLVFFAIKLALLTDVPAVRAQILDALTSVKCMGPSQCDEELIQLMLQKTVAVDTVGTLYYPRICEYLLSGDCPDAEIHVCNLARQLQDRGHMPEAGTLLLNFRGSHPALRTFGNALSSLSRWLHS